MPKKTKTAKPKKSAKQKRPPSDPNQAAHRLIERLEKMENSPRDRHPHG